VGAGLAVALSFALMAGFLRRGAAIAFPAAVIDGSRGVGRWLTEPTLGWAVRGVALVVFVALVVAGLIGTQDAFHNITPIAVWVLWWVGFAFVAAFAGDLWPLVNPWATIHDLLARGKPATPLRRYPERWGAWPAVLLFVAFVWMELAWAGSEVPRPLALAMLAYSALTLAGMRVFGRDVWLARVEVFSVYFSILGRFAPLAGKAGSPGPVLIARPYAVGLLVEAPVSRTMTLFVLLMLASVTYDGLIETPVWAAVEAWFVAAPPLGVLGRAAPEIRRIGLALGWAVFAGIFALVYWGFVPLMAWSAGAATPRPGLAGRFVLTLVPIAIAYHLAHYLSFLLLAGQYAIPILSDPLGWGWDLFGTTLYRVDLSVVDAAFVWYLSVTAIVLGHVVSVYLAHVMALRVYGEPRLALRSQLPMLVLMVLYTMSSLWILSQPIVEG
jgi:hypothetical protein